MRCQSMGERGECNPARALSKPRMDSDPSWQRMPEKLSCAKEAEPDRALTCALDKADEPVGSAPNGSGGTEERISTTYSTAEIR